jgi:hypothetical protein
VAYGNGQAAISVHGVRRSGFNESGHAENSSEKKSAQRRGPLS